MKRLILKFLAYGPLTILALLSMVLFHYAAYQGSIMATLFLTLSYLGLICAISDWAYKKLN